MNIGIIGAGKMGYTLGKHFSLSHNPDINLVGYYSKNINSAIDAAEFTDSEFFDNIESIVQQSDIIFLTVPDGEIKGVVDIIENVSSPSKEKIICHTSGALSSKEIKDNISNVYLFSVHPIYAVNSKYESYIKFKDAFITIEGDVEYIQTIKDIFVSLGHNVKVISANDKVKYHSAAVFSSNLVIGLYHMAEELLKQCGFDEDEVELALKPLFINNANKINETDCASALTGPVERCDICTISKHMSVLDDYYLDVYRLLSRELVKIATNKNPNKNYDSVDKVLKL